MNKPSVVCVVPSIRPESMAAFRKAWAPLFEKHGVTLITVWDGEVPRLEIFYSNGTYGAKDHPLDHNLVKGNHDLFFRRTDAIRNLGFAEVAAMHPEPREADYILTLDDDVHPPAGSDPIQEHLDVLQRRVPISWMNTATEGFITDNHCGVKMPQYLRGFPYGIRDEAPVKVSHGVWVNVPDFDGRTQLELGKCGACDGKGEYSFPEAASTDRSGGWYKCEKCDGKGYDGAKLPYSLPYFRGPIPRGVYAPICGMSLMVHRDALPYLYFAPMGPDTGIEGLNRFADIWMGILLKRAMDGKNWVIYTGASTILHTRASDPFKNVEQEKLGIEWNEWAWKMPMREYPSTHRFQEFDRFEEYWMSYLDKAARFHDLILKLQGA